MRKLTSAEVDTLYGVVYEAVQSGDYYGNKSQYYARLRRLLDWIQMLPTSR